MGTESHYESKNAIAVAALTHWRHIAHVDHSSVVLPDGCRDFIVRMTGEKQSYFISELTHSAFTVESSAGTQFKGIRLRPGLRIDEHGLLSWLQDNCASRLFESDQLDEFCSVSERLSEALNRLADDKTSVTAVAKHMAMTPRSLQRLVKSGTGLTPQYWLSLARVRKAARSLPHYDNLSDAAANAGYADQAHMSRDMKKWFKQTPARIKQDTATLNSLVEKGFG